MRVAGRLLFAALVLTLGVFLFLLARASLARLRHDERSAARSYGEAQPSLVYALGPRPTLFVFTRPQQQVRLLTNAELYKRTRDPHYSVIVEALNGDRQIVWRRDIHARTVGFMVRLSNGRLVPRAFTPELDGLVSSAGDESLIDFPRPVAAVRLIEGVRAPGVSKILARVQEQRPLSNRQLQVGWQRLTRSEQELLTEGNPLASALVGADERRRLLIRRWHPVGPAGVDGRDYHQTTLYERPGALVRAVDRGE